MSSLCIIENDILKELFQKNTETIKMVVKSGCNHKEIYKLQQLIKSNNEIWGEFISRGMSKEDLVKYLNCGELNEIDNICHSNKTPEDEESIFAKLLKEKLIICDTRMGNLVHLKNITISDFTPRAFCCFFVLGKNPNMPLTLERIYELAGEYKIDGRGLNKNKSILTKPSVVRSEIREALKKGTENYRDKISKSEIMNLLDSGKNGTITLQVRKDEVLSIGPLDDITEIAA